MNIVLLHFSSPPVVGGVENVMAHHARLMAGAGHHVSIVAGRGAPFDDRVRFVSLPRCDSLHPEVLAVKAELDRGQVTARFHHLKEAIATELTAVLAGCDLVILHNVASLNKNLALTAALADLCTRGGKPRFLLWHYDLAWSPARSQITLHAGYPWALLRTAWPNATHVTISAERRRELAQLFGLDDASIRVIPPGVEARLLFKWEPWTAELVETLHLWDANPLLLLPARLTPRKNIGLALAVLAELRRLLPHAMLLVTGPAGPHNLANVQYKESLLALRTELQLQGAAHFLVERTNTYVPDAVIADLYRMADALILPSLEEGFGIPLLEAGLARLPVFCTDLPVLHEVGGDDVTYFAPSASPAAIADLIAQRLQQEPVARLAARVRHAYLWEPLYAAQIAPLLEEVVR
jgi:mannosylglucosylglycerate synthase